MERQKEDVALRGEESLRRTGGRRDVEMIGGKVYNAPLQRPYAAGTTAAELPQPP